MSNIYEGPPRGYRIHEPYYIQNTSGFYYQLPDPRIFAYDPQTGDWSSKLLHARRLSDTAYAQSARNGMGYTFGGLTVNENAYNPSDWVPEVTGDSVSTMSKYDFTTGEFNITDMPGDIGATRGVVMHSLDRVGIEGALVAFAGKATNTNNLEQYVSLYFIHNIASETDLGLNMKLAAYGRNISI